MTRRICSKVKSRTTDRASWDCMSCAYSSVPISSIFQSNLAICSYCAAASAFWSAQVGMSGGVASPGRQVTAPRRGFVRAPITRTWSCTRVACRGHRVIQRSRPPTLFMSRTSLGTVQEPLARTDTPDPDGRRRKKVRWNSDSMLEGDKQDDSEENTDECKVRSSCPFMSTSCHLTPTRRRLPRRFV